MPSRHRTTAFVLLGLLGCWALWPARPDASGAAAAQPPDNAVELPPPTREPPVPAPALPPAGPPLPGLVLPPHGPPLPRAVLPPTGPPVILPAPGPMLVPVGPLDPPAPVVAIRVRVTAVSAPKQEIVYRICVHNTSPAPAHHVLVRNPLPANAAFVRAAPAPSAVAPELLWALGTLPPGVCREIVLVLSPLDDNDVRNCARVQFEHGQCVTTRIARTVPLPVLPGVLPPVLPEKKPVPPPQPPEKGPPEKGPPEKGPPEKEPAREKLPPPKQPPEKEAPAAAAKLGLKMTGPKRQYANLPARYEITVSNPGTAAATNVQIVNPLPPGTTLVSASANSRLYEGQVAWNLGTLEAGASRSVQIVLRAKEAGEICNRATAQADGDLKASAEFCTRFAGISALATQVADTKDPVPVGDDTSYRIVIKNQGTLPVTNLRITAVVPPEMQLLKATGPSNPPPVEKLPKATPEGQPLPFAPLQALAPGAEARYEVSVRATQPGDIRFRVEVAADQLTGGPVREEESTRVFTPESGKAP